jgi:hypothetical protein
LRFTLENVNSGLGPTLTLIVGGLLWLLYLAPNLRDRAETRTIERDARRIAATTQELGILPKTPLSQMSSREIAMHRRELERLARTNERHHQRSSRRAVFDASPRLAARYRVIKLALSLAILASIGGGAAAAYFAVWSYLVLAVGFGLLSVVGLIAVNTSDVRPTQRAARPMPDHLTSAVADETWTPIRTPPAHRSMPEGAGLIVTDAQVKAVAARERAARIREQAARAAEPGIAVDPRFTEPAAPAADETGTIDITAALRARRAN